MAAAAASSLASLACASGGASTAGIVTSSGAASATGRGELGGSGTSGGSGNDAHSSVNGEAIVLATAEVGIEFAGGATPWSVRGTRSAAATAAALPRLLWKNGSSSAI